MKPVYVISAIVLAGACRMFLSDTIVIVAIVSGAACYVVYELTEALKVCRKDD